jgi:hypothetical protein
MKKEKERDSQSFEIGILKNWRRKLMSERREREEDEKREKVRQRGRFLDVLKNRGGEIIR